MTKFLCKLHEFCSWLKSIQCPIQLHHTFVFLHAPLSGNVKKDFRLQCTCEKSLRVWMKLQKVAWMEKVPSLKHSGGTMSEKGFALKITNTCCQGWHFQKENPQIFSHPPIFPPNLSSSCLVQYEIIPPVKLTLQLAEPDAVRGRISSP